MGAGATTDYIDEASAKQYAGKYDAEAFAAAQNVDGTVPKDVALEWAKTNMSSIASLWNYSPAGARDPKFEALWNMVTGGWTMMGEMPPEGFITQVKGMAAMFDQQPDHTEACIIEEATIGGAAVFIYTPKTLSDNASKPCLVFYHGGGFIASGPSDWKKTCSTIAHLANVVVVCPFVGVGPEQQGAEWITHAVKALKWTHEQSDAQGIDKTRIGIMGESHGAWTALQVCRSLAVADEACLVKFSTLDIPASDCLSTACA